MTRLGLCALPLIFPVYAAGQGLIRALPAQNVPLTPPFSGAAFAISPLEEAHAFPLPALDGAFSPLPEAPTPQGPAEAPEAPTARENAERLAQLLEATLSGPGGAELEKAVLSELALLHQAGRLEPVLELVLARPEVAKSLPPLDDAGRRAYARQLGVMAASELEGAGYLPGKPFEPWETMSRRHESLVSRSALAPAGPGTPSRLKDAGFIRELEVLSGARFSAAPEPAALIDGPASFSARKRLIQGAKKHVRLMAWAIYDDSTGEQTADLLIQKRREGLRVQVLVDGPTAEKPGHGPRVLKRLEEAGVEVLRYFEPENPNNGLHVKILEVDGEAALAGGMNVGDPYSHGGPGPKWRDTDMLYEGAAVYEGAALFASIWNAQVKSRGLALPLTPEPEPSAPGGPARIALTAQEPDGEARVLLSYLKAIAGATERIYIENAYLITFPSLRRALLGALARGVSVMILTNSPQSVDEPIVSVPIMESLPELIAAGAKVFLKKGDTLHSKFMTVDGIYATVGSFNLHPRSVRYERELTVQVLSAAFAAALDAAFLADTAAAAPIASTEELRIPRSAVHVLIRRYLFNQL